MGRPVDPPLFGPAVGTGGSRQLLRQRGPESGPSLACQPEPRQPKRRTAGPKLPKAAPPPLLSRRASRLQPPVFNRLRPASEVSVGGRGGENPAHLRGGWVGRGKGSGGKQNNRLERARSGRAGKGRERQRTARQSRARAGGFSFPLPPRLGKPGDVVGPADGARGSLFPRRRGEGGEAWVAGATHLSRFATFWKGESLVSRYGEGAVA